MARRSGAGDGRFQLRQNLRDLALFLFAQRQNRQAWQATVKTAQIHGVFDPGDAGFRDDGFASSGKQLLQGLRLRVLATLPEIEELDTFFRQWRGQRQNRAFGSADERGMQHSGGSGQHLELFRRLADDFDDALDDPGTVFHADDVGMISEGDDFWSFD